MRRAKLPKPALSTPPIPRLSGAVPVIATVLALAPPAPAAADAVLLDNGDRLTGEIIRRDAGRVVIETSYAGVIEIDATRIVGVVADDEAAPAAARGDVAPAVNGADGPAMAVASDPPARIAPHLAADEGFSGRIAFATEAARGNSDTNEIDVDLELRYRRGRHEFESMGALEYDVVDDVRNTENWHIYNKYTRYWQGPWYGAAWLRFEQDHFANLRGRYIAGPAIGYRLFDRPDFRLRPEFGVLGMIEELQDSETTGYWGPGWHLDYEQRPWRQPLVLYHRQMGLSTANANKVIWHAWTGLRLPLLAGLFAALEYEIDYDSDPAVQTRATNQTLRMKLGYEW